MSSKGLVLISGLNGYIAASTAEDFLKNGWSVRGTVRSKASAKSLLDTLSEFKTQIEIVEVPEITTEGAFDDAVKGVDAVAHLAAPISLSFTDPEPVLHAAINGTLRILQSAVKEPSIKSFVMMSSIASIRNVRSDDHVFTEEEWNTQAEDIVATRGKETPGPIIYAASKTAAERAFWKFRDENKPSFSMSAVNPALVAGPSVVLPRSADNISATSKYIYDILTGYDFTTEARGSIPGYVDVRDVARVIRYSTEHHDQANNERFIVASAFAPSQAVADILRKAYPDRESIIHEGNPGNGYEPNYAFPQRGSSYYGTKVEKFTGQGYIPWEQTVLDSAKSYEGLL